MNVNAQNQSQHTENVVKFLLKLRNNTMQNLKNALRKLAEKTQGNKDQLLLRLAQKLATEEGRDMVKQYFKPEIYHELYEVDVYSNGNKNNSVYQYYRNMIPQTMNMPGQQPGGLKPNDLMQNPNHQAAYAIQANAAQHFQDPNKAGASSNQVIEIDDEVQCLDNSVSKSGFNQQFQGPGGDNQGEIIPSEMAPIGEPNKPLDQNILRDMHINLKIENIHESKNYPCIADENSLAGVSPIYCHCESYNSEFHRNTNQKQLQKLVQCTKCKRHCHFDCQEENRKMRQSKIGIKLEFNCHHCQFMALDPLTVPIATILRPFKITKLRQEQASQRNAHAKKTMREFIIKESHFSQINPRRPGKSSIRIQVRSIRLDGIGFEHCFPKFGFMCVNDQRNQQDFKIPDPPNHEKKRKDEIHDITSISVQGRNLINIFQTQKDHKGFYAHPGHIVAVFLVKVLQPHDIVNFITQYRTEDQVGSLKRYKQFFGGEQAGGDEVAMVENQETEQVTINLADSITMLPITIPARGEICSHLQCFDLQTYITMNAKHKRWLCPFCNKRSSYVMIDTYFKLILDKMKPLREIENKIDDKITMYKNLQITFTRDNGKLFRRYEAKLEGNKCIEYQEPKPVEAVAAPAKPGSQEQKNGDNKPAQNGGSNENPSTSASNNHTTDDHSQNQQSGSQSLLGKRPEPVADDSPQIFQETPKKKQHNEDAPIEID